VLDIRLIRSETDRVRAELARRQADGMLDEVLALDERRRALQTRVDELRAERNAAAQAIGEAKRAGRDAAAEMAAASLL
jgi:seryl-tRNA synthetase